MWFREWMRQRRFTRAWKQTSSAQYDAGQIDRTDMDKCERAAKDPKIMRKLMKQTETAPGLYGGIKDWDWESILKWIQDYFIPLMKVLLPLLLILDEEDR